MHVTGELEFGDGEMAENVGIGVNGVGIRHVIL